MMKRSHLVLAAAVAIGTGAMTLAGEVSQFPR